MEHLLEWEEFKSQHINEEDKSKNKKDYYEKAKELFSFLKNLDNFYSKENYSKIEDKIIKLVDLAFPGNKVPSEKNIDNGFETIVYAFNHGHKVPSFEDFSLKLSEGLDINETIFVKYDVDDTIKFKFRLSNKPTTEKTGKIIKKTPDTVHVQTDNGAKYTVRVEDIIGVKNEDGEFINEAKTQIKRKYSDTHPARHVYSNAEKRNKVLSFIDSKGGLVSEEEMRELLNAVDEETGPVISKSWIVKNKNLVSVKIGRDASKSYKLTEEGKRILKAIKNGKGDVSEDGEMATLNNTPGMGAVVPPTKDSVGSGDKFAGDIECTGKEDCKCPECADLLLDESAHITKK